MKSTTHPAAAVLGLWTGYGFAQSSRSYCPESCDVVGMMSSNWNVFSSVDRMSWCNKTMLLSFNIYNDLTSPHSTVRLGACAIDGVAVPDIPSGTVIQPHSQYQNTSVSNNSTAASASSTSSLSSTTEAVDVQVLWSGSDGAILRPDVAIPASALKQQLLGDTNTGESLLVAYSNGAAVGVYAGGRIASTSINYLLQQLIDTMGNSTAETVVLQVCGGGRDTHRTLGVVAHADSLNPDLGVVQSALASWHNATCVDLDGSSKSSTPMTLSQSSWTPTVQLRGSHTELLPRASAPKPYANGTCYTYLVKGADTCFALAASYSLTVNDINNFNNNTWGWTGCGNLLADINICLSTGYPPMPPPVAGTECGPQVPGTNPPEPGESLANLNLCPLNACCDIWGHCGITSDYCTVSTSSTGAPGTAAPGENGCVSMCGNDIISGAAPAEFRRIAYFEGFNWDRPCLNMEATDIPEVYTHVHFAFANLTEGYQIDLGHQTIQFELFLGMTRFKKIISIGGWAFSTDPSTYHIFRDAVSNEANRATLVQNIVDFVELFGLDGVDIDWEYPGAPDIPGIPPGNVNEGAHYAVFLSELRAALPSTASLSIAAPASYYYLKQFLIEATAMFVDYIVFMTSRHTDLPNDDLHGQWDYDKAWANPGCPTGNCLRSHVNISETLTALSMITKAGVPSNQVAVGVSSYARAFKMVDPSCTGPQCLFTGPLSGAEPGPCTGTPGYIANAELEGIIANVNINSTQYVDSLSDSNILIWDGNWAAYMDDGNKFTRTRVYQALHFAGTSDWGADLQTISTTSLVPNRVTDPSGGKGTNEICGMTYTTKSDLTIAEAAAIVSTTWSASGAGIYLDKFLKEHGTNDWLLEFLENTVSCGSSKGGSLFDCQDIVSSTCERPNDCITYCPPEAFFIHYSVWQIFNAYKNFYQAITNSAVQQLSSTIHKITDTFTKPSDSEARLIAIVQGIMSTMAGIGTFVGDSGLDSIGAAGDGIAAFATIFQLAQIDNPGSDDPTDKLEEILGSALSAVFEGANTTVNQLFNTAAEGNITFIESFFKNGAFVDYVITDFVIDTAAGTFTSTMNQYLVVQAMKTATTGGPYSSGYCLLISTDTNYYTTEESCTPNPSMIWYNNACIGFGTFSNLISGGQNGQLITATSFLDGDRLDTFNRYVPDIGAAIINSYECFLHPTPSDSATFPTTGLDPSSLLVYPPCFFDLPTYNIAPANQ